MPAPITLDGRSLTIADVVAVARGNAAVALDPESLKAVAASRQAVEAAVERGQTIYGVNTCFGKLAHVRIPPEQARQLQLNLIRSHASGVGEPLPSDAVRAMMLLRANVLVRGTSGVRPVLPELLVEMLNRKLHPAVPSQGSVGASGDLAPLSHLAHHPAPSPPRHHRGPPLPRHRLPQDLRHHLRDDARGPRLRLGDPQRLYVPGRPLLLPHRVCELAPRHPLRSRPRGEPAPHQGETRSVVT